MLDKAHTRKTIWKETKHLRKCFGTGWNDEKLLERELVTSMLTSVDDIEARDRKSLWGRVAGNVGIVLPERNISGTSSSFGGSKGNCQKMRATKNKKGEGVKVRHTKTLRSHVCRASRLFPVEPVRQYRAPYRSRQDDVCMAAICTRITYENAGSSVFVTDS